MHGNTTSDNKTISALRHIRNSYEAEVKNYKMPATEFQQYVNNLVSDKELNQSFTYYAANLNSDILAHTKEVMKSY